MKNRKRLLSLALAAAMLFGLLSASSAQTMAPPQPASIVLPLPVSTATGGYIDELPPLVTFTVPETIWLDQGVSGENEFNPASAQPVTLESQTRIVAYSNITNTAGTQATGAVAFSAAGATNLVITATQGGAPVAAFGTMANASGVNFNHTLANGLHLPTAVPANTAVIIEWVATFELPDVALGTFTSRAFSVAYAPNSRVIGSALWVQHTVHGTGNAFDGWGMMEHVTGAHMLMAGLQTVEFGTLASVNAGGANVFPTATWTLDPQVNLSSAVLSADPSTMTRPINDLFGGSIGRWADATRAFNVTSGQHAQTFSPIQSGSGCFGMHADRSYISRTRPAGAWLDRDIAYAGFRNCRRFGTSMNEATLYALYGTTGRWATHTVERSVGYMHVDSSRFSNLGQVPGMRFSAIVGDASGTTTTLVGSNLHRRDLLDSRPGGTAQGNVVQMGTYTHDFNAYILPVGQVFASHGSQIAITAGTTNVPVEFEHAQIVEIETWESPAGHIQGLMLGNRLTVGFDFDIIGTNKSALRTAALTQRLPDQFYTGDNAVFNTALETIATRLGNPLENNTTVPALTRTEDIGDDGERWQLRPVTYTVTVVNGGGGGQFAVGATVTISADAPEANHHFVNWTLTTGTGVVFVDATSAITTFPMTAGNVTVTANFAQDEQFALTVNGGTGDPAGPHFAGATGTVTANAPPANQHFVRWDGDYGILADRTAAETTFVMTAATATITAVFAADEQFTFTVEGGTGSAIDLFEGTPVTATAPAIGGPDNTPFERWAASGLTLTDDTLNPISFNMPANNVTLIAVFGGVPLFNITVNDGSGGGVDLPAGRFLITAGTAPAGMRFAAWTGDIAALDDPLSASTYVTIADANITVTATFEVIPSFTVTVVGGDGGGTFYEGDVVTITAEVPANHQFVNWTGDVDFANAAFETTTFVMPGNNVTVTANFEEDERFALTVIGGSGAGDFFAGEIATVIADAAPAGWIFVGWTGAVLFDDADAETTTFAMPANDVTVTANFEEVAPELFALTVVNGTGGGNFAAGTTVAIAITPTTGYYFIGWTGDVDFANANAENTTFVMPANNVTVTANFVQGEPEFFAVTVINGTGAGNFVAGATVTVTADAPSVGYEFAGWSGAVTFDNADASIATFVMPANDVIVTAVFVEEGQQLERFAVTVVNGLGSGNFFVGETVTIDAVAPMAGYIFTGWTGNVEFADANAESTTFVMPANDVNVTATFEYQSSGVDKAALIALVDRVGPTQQGNYTDATWAAFQAALTAARVVLDNPDATQEQVYTAYDVLQAAYDALEVYDDQPPQPRRHYWLMWVITIFGVLIAVTTGFFAMRSAPLSIF